MKNLNLENYGVQEMNEKEMMMVDGGAADPADKALAILTGIGIGLTVVGLVATGPIGIAVGIMGGSLGISAGLGGMAKTFFGS